VDSAFAATGKTFVIVGLCDGVKAGGHSAIIR
jgi:hypothetical protein